MRSSLTSGSLSCFLSLVTMLSGCGSNDQTCDESEVEDTVDCPAEVFPGLDVGAKDAVTGAQICTYTVVAASPDHDYSDSTSAGPCIDAYERIRLVDAPGVYNITVTSEGYHRAEIRDVDVRNGVCGLQTAVFTVGLVALP